MLKTEPSQICHTAAEVLGAALSDLLPQGFLLKGGVYGSTFYYDIVLSETLSGVMLPHLESRMRDIVQQKHPIKVHEMIPSNAIGFFRHHRRYYPACFMEGVKDPLVQVIQIDAFVDYVEGEFLGNTEGLERFKLLKIEERPELIHRGQSKRVYRIIGDIQEKKPFQDPLKIGEELGLFQASLSRGKDYLEKVHLSWSAKGEALFFRIYKRWRRLHRDAGFELVIGGGDISKPGCFAEFYSTGDRATTICLEKDLITSLQKRMALIEQLVPLEGEWQGVGPEEHQETFRELGLEWKRGKEVKIERLGSFLSARKNKEFYTIVHSAFPSVERVINLILEDQEKDLSQKKELLSRIADCDE